MHNVRTIRGAPVRDPWIWSRYLTGAIDRLRAGRNLTRQAGASPDFIEASIIDARLKQLQAQGRERADELRRERVPPQR